MYSQRTRTFLDVSFITYGGGSKGIYHRPSNPEPQPLATIDTAEVGTEPKHKRTTQSKSHHHAFKKASYIQPTPPPPYLSHYRHTPTKSHGYHRIQKSSRKKSLKNANVFMIPLQESPLPQHLPQQPLIHTPHLNLTLPPRLPSQMP